MKLYFIILTKYFCHLTAYFNPRLQSPFKMRVFAIVHQVTGMSEMAAVYISDDFPLHLSFFLTGQKIFLPDHSILILKYFSQECGHLFPLHS